MPKDGRVTGNNATWGVFKGCIEADPLDQVGQIKDSGTDPRTGFNHLESFRGGRARPPAASKAV